MSASRLIFLLLSMAMLACAQAGEAEDIAASLNRGQADEALQTADRALSKSPRDARLRLLRGNALAQLGRNAEAIQAYTALTVDYPSLPEPYNNLAALYAQQGQLDKARAALQMALQTNPAYATAHANLADVYAKLAAQAYEKALQRDIVERQNGQAPAPASPATPRLTIVQDLISRTPATGSAPLVIAQASPAKPVTTKPASNPAVAPTVVPPAANTKPPVVTTVTPPVSKPAVVAAAPTVTKSAEIKPAPVTKPEVTKAESSKETEEQIAKSVHGWAEAWSDKRVTAYLASYAKGYKPSGMSRNEWEVQRRERIEAARKIDVKLLNLRIKLDGDTATVRFVQRYKSDKLDTSTGKTLILEKNGGRWLIREERVG